ncbi:MAG: hypothetical protein Ct9H90mP11_02310 [Acidimicrobiales bacterium]|nr:MAG: hypothetical protein Ct9H90mP11_02310 [Acidimicrobiales bacterium]
MVVALEKSERLIGGLMANGYKPSESHGILMLQIDPLKRPPNAELELAGSKRSQIGHF